MRIFSDRPAAASVGDEFHLDLTLSRLGDAVVPRVRYAAVVLLVQIAGRDVIDIVYVHTFHIAGRVEYGTMNY